MPAKPGHILVVEDVPNVLEMIEVTLRFKGYQVETATNGEEALQRVAANQPALVITDILMPKMDGFSLTHSLRSNPQTTKVPVIFVSATYLTSEDKNFALSLGGVRFIEKPIDTEDFLLTVAEVLTTDQTTLPKPMAPAEFLRGYRERLESKLRHKNTQIMRTERLLRALPDEQRPGFQTLLENAIRDRDEIQLELDRLLRNPPATDAGGSAG